MGFIDPKHKAKEGSENGETEEIADILNELGIDFEDDRIEKTEEEKKPDRYTPKL